MVEAEHCHARKSLSPVGSSGQRWPSDPCGWVEGQPAGRKAASGGQAAAVSRAGDKAQAPPALLATSTGGIT